MKKFSANYSHSNHNFVIQNLNGEIVNNKYTPAICIVKNIIQRGKPSILSSYLKQILGDITLREDFNQPYALIDSVTPIWKRIIKGDDAENNFPAKSFFEEIIPTDLKDCAFIQNLLLPEAKISDIIPNCAKEFENQQVDFYLPQAFMVIEIDGISHEDEKQKILDKKRDVYLEKNGIVTIRFSTLDLKEKNISYKSKIKQIRSRITQIHLTQWQRQDEHKKIIKLEDYKKVYNNGIDFNNPNYVATAIIRFQILILELLLQGKLNFEDKWDIEFYSQDISEFMDLAIEDLFIWFERILSLQKVPFARPEVNIHKVTDFSQFTKKKNIKIDFSILKRYTDENVDNPNIIYVRTDYYDEYILYDGKEKFYQEFDYFKVETCAPISYEIEQRENSLDFENLRLLAWDIFMQSNTFLTKDSFGFREGQLEIISTALNRIDTIGLLPTGSGKSLCYQLACFLQPCISFVVCPIKSLMVDQSVDLQNVGITRVASLTSDNTSLEREIIQKNYGLGKYMFIFISPERFQTELFRQYLSSINQNFDIAYAVIDEAHCLSEWGHDFRTSYLNLVSAIKKHCKTSKFIALTATASSNVLKDLKVELGIKNDEDVKTPKDYSREELEFFVENCSKDKYEVLIDVLKDVNTQSFYNENCGIIFTAKKKASASNRTKGCYDLSNDLSEELELDIPFYCGGNPDTKRFLTTEDFNQYKQDVQKGFKENKYKILTSTKAFGMGVNKGNVAYTIHYGLPASMESLYQEAGRAGREKKLFVKNKALCYVLFSKENFDQNQLNILWDKNSNYDKILNKSKDLDGDLATHFYFFVSGTKNINDDAKFLTQLYEYINEHNKKNNLLIKGSDFIDGKVIKAPEDIEKYIYKLKQLGVVSDWTVDFKTRSFDLLVGKLDYDSIKKCLQKNINKYDPEFNFENLVESSRYTKLKEIYKSKDKEFKKLAKMLLQWTFDTFLYSRRQSLKTVYETCISYVDGKLDSRQFKEKIENYFRFSNKTHIMQQIANEPLNYTLWFDIFYKFEDSVRTEQIIDYNEAQNLIISLGRFLESYMQNTGLDIVSGLLRLFVNEYENYDGRNRLENSLGQIAQLPEDDINEIFDNMFKMCKDLSYEQKNQLTGSLTKNIKFTKQQLINMHNNLKDENSLLLVTKDFASRMNKIKEKFEV